MLFDIPTVNVTSTGQVTVENIEEEFNTPYYEPATLERIIVNSSPLTAPFKSSTYEVYSVLCNDNIYLWTTMHLLC